MALQPFVWSGNQAISTPEAAERRRRVAEAMIGQAATPASNWAEGLSDVAAAFTGTQLQNQAAAAEEAGRASAAQALAGLGPNAGFSDIAGALSNPWLSQPQSTIAAALLQQNMQQSDPMYQAQLAQLTAPKPVDPWANTKIINDQIVGWGENGPQVIADYSVQEPEKAPTVQKVTLSDGSEMAVQWDPASSAWIPINAPEGGGSLKPQKGMTESQSKLTLFQTLQTETQPVLLDLETQFDPANINDAAARSTPIAGNFFQSEQGQIYNSAARAWAEGALRIATGAAATPEEMERTLGTYFAQPGDTPNTIAFKAQMREMYNRAINNSLGQSSGGSLPLPSQFATQLSGASTGGAPSSGITIRRIE
jgi:hypothetical protein